MTINYTHNRAKCSDSLYHPFRVQKDCMTTGSHVDYPGFSTYALLFITQGKGELITKYETFLIEGPFCVHIPNALPFKLVSGDEAPMEFVMIEYTLDHNQKNQMNLNQFRVINLNKKRMDTIFSLLLHEIDSPSSHFNAIIGHIFNLIMIFEKNETNQKLMGLNYTRLSQNVRTAQYFMDHNFNRKISIQEIATHANLSPDYFIKVFHNEIGMTPHQYIVRCRMEHAHLLIESTQKTIQDIAKECGYNSVSHFSTKFKEFYGYTPRNLKTR